MRRTRFQRGSIVLDRRVDGSHVWLYRWRDSEGRRQGARIGTIAQFRNKSLAWAEAERQELPRKFLGIANLDSGYFSGLVERYINEAMSERYSTRRSDSSRLKKHILPKWGSLSISQVDPLVVEEWLKEIPLSPKSKGHVKGLMTILFNHAMKWKYIPLGRNPMELVKIKGGTKRKWRPNVLSQGQFRMLLGNVEEDYIRIVVIVAMCLGLRFSEVLALKWLDVDWKELTIYVRRGIVDGRIGEVKTEYSDAPAPLDPALAEILLNWKAKAEFTGPEDWIIASPFNAGKQPYFPTAIRRKIHDAAKKAGLGHLLKGEPTKILRHSYRAWLGMTDAPLAVIKDLMRHADIRTTFNEYGNGLPQPMRDANKKVVEMALKAEVI